MVDIIGRAKVIIEGDVDSSSIDSAGSKIGSSLKKGALIGVAALGTVAVAGYKAFQAFEEAEAQSKKLNQVLDNMGNSSAGPAVEKLADDLRKLTGVDDEAIKGGQTLLATFSELAKSAGDTGGMFERATKLSLDMAASGFGSIESASIQLGKALQEPAKGVAALARTGAFTRAQQEYVKALDETGKKAEAQAYILKVLEGQVGGTAEKSATSSAKIKSALGELNETFGLFVDDLISGGEGSKTFAERLEELNTQLTIFEESESWAAISTGIRGIGEAIEFAGGLIGDFLGIFVDLGERTAEFKEEMSLSLSALGGQFNRFKTDVSDAWEGLTHDIGNAVDDIVADIKGLPKRIGESVSDWADAGAKLVTGFIGGLFDGVAKGNIAQTIKAAINKALPDTITFFGGAGGVPAVTVKVPQFASGVSNFSGGLALVGERGPELVSLPGGSDVYSNSQSRDMVSGDVTNVFNISTTGPVGDSLLAELNWWGKFGSPTAVSVNA